MASTRRQFVQNASLAVTGALVSAPLRLHTAPIKPADAGGVNRVRLDQDWRFRKGPLLGIWEVWRAEEADQWQPVSLPHCVNALDACDPDSGYFRGQSWYRTEISVRNPYPNGRTILHFQGAGQTTTLWVGSTLVGTHKGGYDEFAFDITDAVGGDGRKSSGGNVQVAIVCDNAPDAERVPSDLSDFCLYGGLYRHVNLIYLPAVSVEAVHVSPSLNPDGSAAVRISARLWQPVANPDRCSLRVDVTDAAGRSVHSASRDLDAWTGFADVAAFAVPAAKLWSPEDPHLYNCEVHLSSARGEMAVKERFGIRHTEFVEHGPFKLNGKRVLLRGTHRHVDHAGLAAGMPDDLVRQELQMIRDMGANFIRLAHYQQDRLVLDLCDELGLMVWEEAPWCRAGVGDSAFQKNAKDMLTHMIEQHYNHPSIILWGLGNEDDWPNEYPALDQNAIRAFMTEMRDLAHSLDHSRLTSIRRCDFARDIPDVYSPSIWAGWYRGDYHEYEQNLTTERDRVKRMIHMEWGADSQAGRHSEEPEAIAGKVQTGTGADERGLDYLKTGGSVRFSRDGDWSESYACDLFDWHLKTQERLDWLTGAAQWIFKDFASPLRGDNDIPHINQKGVVERDLTKKESYYVFQSYWTEKPMIHIYGHTWPVRWGRAGQQRVVKVYSNCERAELFLNGHSLGSRTRNSQDFPAAGLRWNVSFVAGKNHLRAIGFKGAESATDEIDLTYQTEPWSKPAELRLIQTAQSNNTVTVLATLHDSKGALCLDARNAIQFSLAGDGKLIDNLGTARGSRILQMYNGRAEISLSTKGRCIVGVSSEGVPAVFLNL